MRLWFPLFLASFLLACGSDPKPNPPIEDTQEDKGLDFSVPVDLDVPPDIQPEELPTFDIPDVVEVIPDLQPDIPEVDETTGPDINGHPCTKDSDCAPEDLALLPCQKPLCDKHLSICVPGPRSPGEICDDGNACTTQTTCTLDGACVGLPVHCDDGNLCTTDFCFPDSGCAFQPNDNVCDDGNACTKNDRCNNHVCVGEVSLECTCSTDSDCNSHNDTNLCNGVVLCLFGTCKVPASSIVTCNTTADSPCRKTVCTPETGECGQIILEDGRPCDDANACTIGDLCKAGVCIGSAPRSCDDGNVCTNDTCDSVTGCQNEFSLFPCDDNDPCSQNDFCRFGQCMPGPLNSCTTETCFPKWSLHCDGSDTWATDLDGTTKLVNQYSCSAMPMPGGEFAYSFVAPYDGKATITLDANPANTFLFLLESKGTGCDATNCRTSTNGTLTLEMFQGRSYFLVVDTTTDTPEPYSVSVSCLPQREIRCDDGLDEDADGTTDCADPDCEGNIECPSSMCTPVWTLSCNSKDFATNYGLWSTSLITTYADISGNRGCLDNQYTYEGPEFAYRFDAPGDFNVTVRLSDESSMTDLLILKDAGNGCQPLDCVAWGLKKVSFPAQAGERYYFVVDGYKGAEGSFDIEVLCSGFVETSCHNDVDDDLDSFTDCDDPDCVGALECIHECLAARTITCGHKEAFANFGWGSTQAINQYSPTPACPSYQYTGPEIAYRFVAPYTMQVKATLQLETASTDILVLQGDQCLPDHCITYGLSEATFTAQAGETYHILVDGFKAEQGTFLFDLTCSADTEVLCDDGQDNDGDGLVDCADEVDCAASPLCPKCTATYPIKCGDVEEWNNGSDGKTTTVRKYGCQSAIYDGPEYAYAYTADDTSSVTFEVESAGWDLDVMVLSDNGFGCNPAVCLAWGTNSATLQAVKGETYFVVVDGYGEAPLLAPLDFGTSDFTLRVLCGTTP